MNLRATAPRGFILLPGWKFSGAYPGLNLMDHNFYLFIFFFLLLLFIHLFLFFFLIIIIIIHVFIYLFFFLGGGGVSYHQGLQYVLKWCPGKLKWFILTE